MTYSLKAIAKEVGGELFGDPDRLIERVRDVQEAGPGEIAVLFRTPAALSNPPRASALVVPLGFPPEALNGCGVIRVKNPREALVTLLGLLHPQTFPEPRIDPGASVSPDAKLGPGVFIGFGACVEKGAVIGARAQVHANAYVGEGVSLGEDTVLYPSVTLYAGVRVGNRVRIHAGTVIGSDGFGFPRGEDGVLRKIPQIGGVEIEDDVEIGANCAIDRATLEKTRIGRGTKIDNLVQIGHNTVIGRDCCLMGQVGISGSVRLGDSVTLSGQVGVADHVTIADGAAVGAQAGVVRDLSSGRWVGSPALPAPLALKVLPIFARLPEMRRQIRALEERCAQLEEELQGGKGGD